MPDFELHFCEMEPLRHEALISCSRVIEVINALFDRVGLSAGLFPLATFSLR